MHTKGEFGWATTKEVFWKVQHESYCLYQNTGDREKAEKIRDLVNETVAEWKPGDDEVFQDVYHKTMKYWYLSVLGTEIRRSPSHRRVLDECSDLNKAVHEFYIKVEAAKDKEIIP
jgi:hypothetical protein